MRAVARGVELEVGLGGVPATGALSAVVPRPPCVALTSPWACSTISGLPEKPWAASRAASSPSAAARPACSGLAMVPKLAFSPLACVTARRARAWWCRSEDTSTASTRPQHRRRRACRWCASGGGSGRHQHDVEAGLHLRSDDERGGVIRLPTRCRARRRGREPPAARTVGCPDIVRLVSSKSECMTGGAVDQCGIQQRGRGVPPRRFRHGPPLPSSSSSRRITG